MTDILAKTIIALVVLMLAILFGLGMNYDIKQRDMRRAYIAQECDEVPGRDYEGCKSRARDRFRNKSTELNIPQGETNASILE